MSLYLATVTISCFIATTSAIPELLSSASYRRTYPPGYYPPAEPNYPIISLPAKSMMLPPSDEEAALADEGSRPRMLPKEKITSQVHKNGKLFDNRYGGDEKLIVHVSSAIHPDNFENGRLRNQPKLKGPQDMFVINEPHEVFTPPKTPTSSPQITVGPFKKEWSNKQGASSYVAGPVVNPANYFLKGADFKKVAAPKCRLSGCDGPFPDDGSIIYEMPKHVWTESCHQTFVPLNSCVGDKGYPVGMVCTICCQCTTGFVNEMRRTRGYLEGFSKK